MEKIDPPTVPAAVGEATIMCEGPQTGSWGSVNWSHPAGDIVYRCQETGKKIQSLVETDRGFQYRQWHWRRAKIIQNMKSLWHHLI